MAGNQVLERISYGVVKSCTVRSSQKAGILVQYHSSIQSIGLPKIVPEQDEKTGRLKHRPMLIA